MPDLFKDTHGHQTRSKHDRLNFKLSIPIYFFDTLKIYGNVQVSITNILFLQLPNTMQRLSQIPCNTMKIGFFSKSIFS